MLPGPGEPRHVKSAGLYRRPGGDKSEETK